MIVRIYTGHDGQTHFEDLADTGIPGPTWAGAAPQGARPEGSGPMSGVWCSRPSSRVDQMGKDTE